MEEALRARLAEAVRSFHIPRLHEIPDVGLYLEQVTRYVNGVLEGCGIPPLTASMVSNYVKQHIIPGPGEESLPGGEHRLSDFRGLREKCGQHGGYPLPHRHSEEQL